MLDFRPVFMVVGILVTILGLFMLLPALFGRSDVFLGSAAISLFTGIGLYIVTRHSGKHMSLKQAFLMTALVWIVLPAFAALPLFFGLDDLGFTNAYFEAMSGLTTTGATILSGLDSMDPSILIWRAVLQWLGGLGIVVMAIAVLPVLGIGGMQMFKTEGFDTTANIIPRARELAAAMTKLYVSLTVLCAIILMLMGLSPLDGFSHAMSTLSTGGYSTHDLSVGFYNSVGVEMVILLFMIAGSLPFVLYLQMVRGKPLALWHNSQVHVFLLLSLALTAFVTFWLAFFKDISTLQALRYASFNVVSTMTGTGFSSTDYGAWGAFSATAFFMIMFIGGCAGSTSCSIKIFRFQILFATLWARIRQIHRPHGVFQVLYNGQPVGEDVSSSVMSFLFLFFLSFLALALALALTGLDPVTALSGAATAITNVGPGLGDIIGPAGNFQSLPDISKWLLSFGMLLGRLEVFSILVLLTPNFWRA